MSVRTKPYLTSNKLLRNKGNNFIILTYQAVYPLLD